MSVDFIGGCIAGCSGAIVGHPLDTVKVVLQTQNSKEKVHRGTWDCFRNILKTESVRGLFKGVTAPLGGTALVNAAFFGTHGLLMRYLDAGQLRSHFIAGAGAGCLQSFIVGPLELAKTRLQVQKKKIYSGSIDCLMKVMKQDGLRGVYRGLFVTIARDIPSCGTYFLTYEFLAGEKKDSTSRMFIAGGLAGVASWLVVFPLDAIKSRYQVDGYNGPPRFSSAMDCFAKSVKAEGYGIVCKGLGTILMRSFPTNAVTFTVFTWITQLHESWKSREDNSSKDPSGFWHRITFEIPSVCFHKEHLSA